MIFGWHRFRHGFGQIDERSVAEGGMDRVHLQRDTERAVLSAFEQSHPQGYQGTKCFIN
jgi:hypothetical protein